MVAILLGAMVLAGAVAVVSEGGSTRPGTSGSTSGESVRPAATTPFVGINGTVSANVSNGTAPLSVEYTVNATGPGAPFTYLWQFGDSNNSGYLTSATVSHTFTYPRTFVAEVNVTNVTGFTARLLGPPVVVLSSSPPPPNPISVRLTASTSGGPIPLNFEATASPTGCTPECNVTMFLSGGSQVGYTPIGADPGPEIPNGANYTVHGSITTSGAWTVSAIVAQPGGLTNYSEWSIDATAPGINFSAAILAVPASGPAPLDVRLVANLTDGAAPFGADWSFGDGGNGTGLLVNHTYTAPGTYVVSLYAWDANGTPAFATTEIVVTAGGSGPSGLVATLIASPSSGSAPLTVHLLIGASGGTSPYTVTLCSQARNCSYTQTDWDGSSENLTAVYATSGNFTATATVTDSGGNQSVASTLVSVLAYAPLNVSASDSVRSGTSPLEVELEASLRGGVAPYTIQWAFGDGSFGSSYSGAVVTHLYSTPGRYVPTVTIRDVTGHQVVETLTAVVVPGSSAGSAGSGLPAGPASTAGLIVVGALAGAAAVFAASRGIDRRRWRREGEELVDALRAERPPP